MCGVVGRIGGAGPPPSDGQMLRALEAMSNRGPDARATFASDWLSLGHTRLAILDLEDRSNQPFFSPDRRYVIAYNGEVYNYRELRSELEAERAWIFQTDGDTEVVLAALVQWGVEALNRFNGMWAFCFADLEARSGIVARDRFGVKPMYWTRSSDRSITFGSSVPAVECLLDRSLGPDLVHLAAFLLSSYTSFEASTFYAGVNELRPGRYLSISGDAVSEHTFWSFTNSPGEVVENEREVVDEIGELMRSSVELRLRSDVPVAVTLSGGVDSSTIATLAARSDSRVAAFTADTGGHDDNEADAAERLCGILGIDHFRIEVDSGQLDLARVSSLIAVSDGPLTSPSAVALDQIMAAVRLGGYPVVLEGQGADEVFGGYIDQLVPRISRQHLLRGQPRRALQVWQEMAEAHGVAWSAIATTRELVPFAHSIYMRRQGLLPVLGPRLNAAKNHVVVPVRKPSMSPREVLDNQLIVGLRGLLTYGDRSSMASSVEARQPFLDYRLVEYMGRWDAASRIGSGRGKRLLREFARQILPTTAPLDAPKRGFVMPVREWVSQADVREHLLRGACVRDGLFDQEGVATLLDRSGRRDSSHLAVACFRLLMCELWYSQTV